jgi:hypothetical protein
MSAGTPAARAVRGLRLADWTVLGTEVVLWGLPAVVFAVAAATSPLWPALILGAGAVAFAYFGYRRLRRVLTGDYWRSRVEMTHAMRRLPKGVLCLARDEHVVLLRGRMYALILPVVTLMRLAEDDVEEFSRTGAGALVATTFKVSPLHLWVIEQTGGSTFTEDDAGEIAVVPEAPRSRTERARGEITVLRMLGRGALYAQCADLRELTAQIRAAEPLGPKI